MATTPKLSAKPPSPLATVPADRIKAVVYYPVDVATEGGKGPYVVIAFAGGSSCGSLGVVQTDFAQRPAQAAAYARALVDWHAVQGKPLAFDAKTLKTALISNSFTPEMRKAVADFGSSKQGVDWIHQHLDMPQVNGTVSAVQRALATPYGQAVIKEGKHVDEFMAFAAKIYNQYGNGVEGANGTVKSPGFGAFMDYLNHNTVLLKDNQHKGKTVTVTAQQPGVFDRADLLSFARAYTDTRRVKNEGVYNGPRSALQGGEVFGRLLNASPPISGIVKRALSQDFSPSSKNPDVELLRGFMGTDLGKLKQALADMDKGTGNAARLPITLGGYPGHLSFDPASHRVAIDYPSGRGYEVGPQGYTEFDHSTVVKGSLGIKQPDGSVADYRSIPLTQALPTSSLTPQDQLTQLTQHQGATNMGQPASSNVLNEPSNAVTPLNQTQGNLIQTPEGAIIMVTHNGKDWKLQSRPDGSHTVLVPGGLSLDAIKEMNEGGKFNSWFPPQTKEPLWGAGSYDPTKANIKADIDSVPIPAPSYGSGSSAPSNPNVRQDLPPPGQPLLEQTINHEGKGDLPTRGVGVDGADVKPNGELLMTPKGQQVVVFLPDNPKDAALVTDRYGNPLANISPTNGNPVTREALETLNKQGVFDQLLDKKVQPDLPNNNLNPKIPPPDGQPGQPGNPNIIQQPTMQPLW
jgi:hypothetical protein